MTAKTDRELLELAAKAAGIELAWDSDGPCYYSDWRGLPQKESWNPLTEDGDALRLANALEFSIHRNDQTIGVSRYRAGAYLVWQDRGLDDDAATRRAIVRAAAVMGETL